MASFKYNPFTGNFDIVDNNELLTTNSVWVDIKYGNDSTGVPDRKDKPFETINAAWDAMETFGGRNNFTMYISKGAHTLTETLSDAAFGNAVRKISIVCDGMPNQCLITSAFVGPILTISATSSDKFVSIEGGDWTRTSITGSTMFNVSSSDRNEFIIKGANVNDVSGTGAVFTQRSTELVKDCRVTGTANASIFVGSGANTSTLKVMDSYFSFPTASAVFSSNTIRPNTWTNCEVRIPTGIIATANGNVSFTSKDLFVEGTGVLLDGRALGLRCENTKLKTLTNNPVVRFDTQTGLSALRADGLYLEQPDTTTASCITRSGRGMCPAHIYGRGLYYSERNPPNAGSDPSTTDSGPNGRVGFVMSTATIGNVITINLVNSMLSGAAYNTAPIVYNVASTNVATELLAMQAAVQAQVAIPGTPWNIWCQGDTSLVRATATQLRIIMHPLAPGYTSISTTTNYTTDTLGDVTNDSNLLPDGIVNVLGGPQYALIDIPRRNGDIDYPETLITPILNIRQF